MTEVDPAPFDLAGRLDAAALCLHGLTGTPYEVRPLGEALAAAGVRALGPALPGHVDSPDALVGLPYSAWLGAAREHLAALRREHARVFVVGLSLGGLLALALASEEAVDGLVVVGTPLRLRSPLAPLAGIASLVRSHLPKSNGSDIRDDAARDRHPSYDVMPLASVHQLRRLQARVRPALVRVTAPILVAHGAHDRTAHPDDARVILAGVSAGHRALHYLPRSGHVVPVDHDGPRLAEAVVAHLRPLA